MAQSRRPVGVVKSKAAESRARRAGAMALGRVREALGALRRAVGSWGMRPSAARKRRRPRRLLVRRARLRGLWPWAAQWDWKRWRVEISAKGDAGDCESQAEKDAKSRA